MHSFSSLDRLPCSSLLLRVRQAPMMQDGLRALGLADTHLSAQEQLSLGVIVPSRDYGFGGYNTSFSRINDTEQELFQIRQKRSDQPTSEAVRKLHASLVEPGSIDTAQEMAVFIHNQVVRTPNTPIIDLTYFSQYVASVGFKISIDGFHNSGETKHPLVTLTTLCPPATFYHSPDDIPPEVVLNLTYNWDSPLSSPAYNEGYFKYRDIPSSPSTFLVIDVRKAVVS